MLLIYVLHANYLRFKLILGVLALLFGKAKSIKVHFLRLLHGCKDIYTQWVWQKQLVCLNRVLRR